LTALDGRQDRITELDRRQGFVQTGEQMSELQHDDGK
jgi:hypothetical protein